MCACNLFSTMAVREVSLIPVLQRNPLTITLGEPAAHPAITLVIHPLHHHAIPLKIVSYVVAPSTVLQPIDLLLSTVGSLLRLFELLLQLLDLAILLRVALFLSMLLALV